jgi:hypothetical protein
MAVLAALALAGAAYAQTEANFKVTPTDDGAGVIITGYTGTVAAVRIPATIQRKPVREIGEKAFYQNFNITSVTIPAGVTKIGNEAFASEEENKSKMKLASVTIPEGVTEIGNRAFAFSPLTAVTLPQSLTTLGYEAFAGTGITAVILPNALTNFGYKNYDDAFYSSAFHLCEKLETVTLPEDMKELPADIFDGCFALTAITLPEGMETLSIGAFASSGLTSITLPASIKRIDAGVFWGCGNLETVTVPKTLKKVGFGKDTFEGTKLDKASQAALKKLGYKGKF